MTPAQAATAYSILHNLKALKPATWSLDRIGAMADCMVESFGPEAATFALECQRDAEAGGYDGHAETWGAVRAEILEMSWRDPEFRAAALRALRDC